MKLDRNQFTLHAAWAFPAIVVTVACGSWYSWSSWRHGAWLGGGSMPGLVCGIVSGLIIVFEMLLWPRKALRRFRLGPTKHWMAAHLWLGMVCLPLAIFHCGFHLGGTLPTVLMVLLTLTVASGLLGLFMQNVLPAWMLHNLPAETIFSQIDYVSQQSADDIRRMLRAACGPAPGQEAAEGSPKLLTPIAEPDYGPHAIVVGAVRDLGRTRGRTLLTASVSANRQDRQILWSAFSELEPYLLHGASANESLTDPLRAEKYFDHLRRSCQDESSAIVDVLRQHCNQRRQFDLQRRAHRWLHGWIPFHLALSVALIVLLVAHIWTALKYW